VASFSHRVKTEPNLASLLIDRQILSRFQSQGLAENDLDEDAFAVIDLILGRASDESKKMIAYQRSINAEGPGYEALDYEEVHQARRKLTTAIKRVLEVIKAKVTTGQRQKAKERRSYAKPHLFINESPGRQDTPKEGPRPEAVIVLDTSGSMWMPELLAQMASLVYQLRRRKVISKAYCCDTKLHPLEVSLGGNVKFKGAGGTSWTSDHHSQIIKDLKTNKTITIYYCTDGVVNGLEEAANDDRVSLYVINIPHMLNLELYEEAQLQ